MLDNFTQILREGLAMSHLSDEDQAFVRLADRYGDKTSHRIKTKRDQLMKGAIAAFEKDVEAQLKGPRWFEKLLSKDEPWTGGHFVVPFRDRKSR